MARYSYGKIPVITNTGIYSAADYRLMAGKESDQFFSQELVESAFRKK